MKKYFCLHVFVLIVCIVHVGLQAQNVGIGTVTPSFRLDVQGDPASMLLTNIYSKVNYAGNLQIKAFEGNSVTADGWGIGGSFIGGNRGADCIAQGGTYTGWTYGISGSATGTMGHRVGVYGTATGGGDNYGVYGYADGGANYIGVFGQNLNLTGYAGYFDGRGLFKYELRTNDNLLVDDNIGVGTLTPAFRVDVQGDPANSTTSNVNSKVNYVGNQDLKAFQGNSVTNPGYGIGGGFTGGYKGVDAFCQGGSYTNIPLYGVYSNATGTAGTRVGTYGTASGGTANYGIWGSVNGGANHYGVFGQNTNQAGYAGYFDGRGLFVNELRTNDNFIADDNVGIGTTTPSTKLQIIGGADAGLATNGYAQFGPTSSWNLVLDDNEIMARSNGAANDLLFQQDAGNILMCGLEQGKVGIGVQLAGNLPTGYMLAVDGKIIGEEMRIQNSDNWPDYVFSDQYSLLPLDDLKKSIDIHKHLPNIPSAETVEQDGILIGDMQKRMMEKIEELTLYILDMNEINKHQQAEIEQLKSAIAELKK